MGLQYGCTASEPTASAVTIATGVKKLEGALSLRQFRCRQALHETGPSFRMASEDHDRKRT
jgi:predicted kinase